MIKKGHTEVAIIGSGIVGLAMAFELSRKGKNVTVFEKSATPHGASVRNFGTIWPIGQKVENYQMAIDSRNTWLELENLANLQIDHCGSLHAAYHEDELAVLEEFVALSGNVYGARVVNAKDCKNLSDALISKGLKGALYSETELTVSSRQVIPQLVRYLKEVMKVKFEFNTFISNVKMPVIQSAGRYWTVERVFVCSGSDFEQLYPELYEMSGLHKCKLQMMSATTKPASWRLGPILCGGLTLRHYSSFMNCPSVEKITRRFNEEEPILAKYGIHIIVAQNSDGQLIIGDSHEYDSDIDPFDKEEINDIIVKYTRKLLDVPSLLIQERWHGLYLKHNVETEYVYNPEQSVTIVNGLGGAGMTLSFGLAKRIVGKE